MAKKIISLTERLRIVNRFDNLKARADKKKFRLLKQSGVIGTVENIKKSDK